MKAKLLLVALLISVQAGFAQNYQKILQDELSDEMPGILFSIKSGDGKTQWSGAAGVTSIEEGSELMPENTFRMASVTKTYVAAAILRLMEKGILNLDDPISPHISEEHQAILSQDYEVDKITIRQTLRHSAGFFDHTNAPDFFPRVLENPDYEWTRTEQFQLCVDQGEPIGPPGEQFRYSDTGYLILGEIIERYTGKDLDGGIKELLKLESFGLERTDFERKDPKTDELRIHQYFQGIDTYGFSPTIDYYGGGGLLSTTEELVLFFEALFTDQIFEKPETLEIMLEPVTYSSRAGMDYQMGMYRIQINDMLAYTHTGFWGTQVVYMPQLDLYMSANYSSIWKGSGIAPVFSKILREF
ncbi:serine hydrolase domain-containing protein [Algoriphagus sediminis]|uniref:Serine hydrolase domain-containing protein n=1 Tax=Algoriphagus sediminis TaxID=3057113 RepID=A0ABT7YGG0_9BACT|nr:serine hydrolase domain-containing protein [Algoriphagus sediminis]MDN3205608.1 serine hydrolase domain-containing protein [Algoriphagus sediminis]